MSSSRGRSSPLQIYLEETRDIGLSLLMVLPLLLAYEIVMLSVAVPMRNGAEAVALEFLQRLPPASITLLRRGIVLLLMIVALVLLRRRPPSVARARFVLAESLVLALLLGPLVSTLVGGIGLSVAAPAAPAGTVAAPSWMPYLLSVGAGLWEEIVFRLVLLGGLLFLLVRCFAVPQRAALAVSILVSALAFALYHHLGDNGEPLAAGRFAFRAIAGTILGVLFAFRGFAVVVYMHIFYDLLCDFRALHG